MSIFTGLFSGFSSCSVAMDLGTVNTLVALRGYGVVLSETSAIAVSTADTEPQTVFAVGNEAIEMCGRTPSGMQLRFPFRHGVIADYMLAERMIRYFLEKVAREYSKALGVWGPRLLLCVPGCVTQVERRALEEAARQAGARDVLVMEEALAACIGAGLPFNEPTASIIADIGGGTTNVAVVSLGGIASQKSIRIGGNDFDEAITALIRRKYDLRIGEKTAEWLKIEAGAAGGNEKIEIKGSSIGRNLPKSAIVPAAEVSEALSAPIAQIIYAIRDVMAATPPELAGDILSGGITLTGGSALLTGLAEKVEADIGIPTRPAPTPLQSVALGALRTLESLQTRREVAMFHELKGLMSLQ